METSASAGKERSRIRYSTVFILFIVGSVLGVLMEGLWYMVDHGGWETHVVTIWGPFCIIYGLGFAGCYVGTVLMRDKGALTRFVVFAIGGAAVEFICGWVILRGYGMRAWDYSGKFLNIMGLTDLNMSILWGVIGVAFGHLVPYIERFCERLHGRLWHCMVVILSIYMAVNILWTSRVIGRWAYRHWNQKPVNAISRMIDSRYTDEYLSNRYVEWWFLDEDGPARDKARHNEV